MKKRNTIRVLLLLGVGLSAALGLIVLSNRAVSPPPPALEMTLEERYTQAVNTHRAAGSLEGEARAAGLRAALDQYRAVMDAAAGTEDRWIAAESLLAAGHLHRLLGETASALVSYQRVVEAYPDQDFTRLQALKSWGDAAAAEGDSETAREAYQTIVQLYGGRAEEELPPAVRQIVLSARRHLEQG